MRARRVDSTAKDLTGAARDLGLEVLIINDAIDALLFDRKTGRVHVVDWKSKDGTLTPTQARLVAAGWPIKFIQDVDQLILLVKGES